MLLPNITLNTKMDFLVIDVNVALSSILGFGNSLRIFELNVEKKKFKFIAPEYLSIEFGKHAVDLAKRSKFSIDESQEAIRLIVDQLTFVSENDFRDKLNEARKILGKHEKDVPYLALAIAKNCDILSGDKIFKELVPEKVKTPREILEMFEKD